EPYVSAAARQVAPDVRKKFGELYLYDLVWRQEPGDLNKEMSLLQTWLRHTLAVRGRSLQWVATWVDRQSGLPSVTLAEYWGGQPQPGEKVVGASFTRKGSGLIDGLVSEVEGALGEPKGLAAQKAEFDRWYRGAAFEAWAGFGTAFPRGADHLKTGKEWQQMAARMTGSQGPYPALLSRMATELEPLVGSGEGLPGWVAQLYRFRTIRTAADAGKDKGSIGKAVETGAGFLTEIEKTLGRDVTGQAAVAQAAKAYQEYRDALFALTPATQSRNQALQAAAQTFSEDAATSKSPFYAAFNAAGRVRAGLGTGDELVGRLAAGPADFLWAYVRNESACALQAQWEEKVLAEAQGVGGAAAGNLLLGPDGLVWKFVKGPAAPFLGRSLQRGFQPKEALGGGIPFEPAFLSFLSRGAVQAAAAAAAPRQANYPVAIRGLPTDVNPDARMKPQTTRLELRCATGSQSLVNQNYPVSKTFVWAPDSCNDVIFQIEAGDVVLVKRYLGEQGFPQFLRDFQGGKRVFYSNEFPAEKAVLDRYGIKYIRVNYQFGGDRALLAHAGAGGAGGGGAPRSIARCWAP
ncbi:MAG: type VI secretion system protein ImpL, partial [Deltaproteobacteria bacterium]|nr:type VI secretion system protein ImpL [Deltaproteobacteria bacterium]